MEIQQTTFVLRTHLQDGGSLRYPIPWIPYLQEYFKIFLRVGALQQQIFQGFPAGFNRPGIYFGNKHALSVPGHFNV